MTGQSTGLDKKWTNWGIMFYFINKAIQYTVHPYCIAWLLWEKHYISSHPTQNIIYHPTLLKTLYIIPPYSKHYTVYHPTLLKTLYIIPPFSKQYISSHPTQCSVPGERTRIRLNYLNGKGAGLEKNPPSL